MLVSRPEPERTLQLSIPMEVFNRNYGVIVDKLPPSMRAKLNSKYDTKTIVEYLMMMCSEGASHEGISQMWRDRIGRRRVPTGACLLKRIGGSAYPVTRDACDGMLDVILDDPLARRTLQRPVITSTDEHDVPAMFNSQNDEYMTTGKPKGGTTKMLRYTTIKITGGHVGLTAAIHPTGKNYRRAGIVRYLLEKIRRAGITSKMHLLDRGFYTAEVIRTLIEMNQPFTMPAIKSKKIVRFIQKYHDGKGKAVLPYTIRGKDAQATFTLVIIPNKNAKEDDPIKDRYLAFATNVSPRKARATLANIPGEYRKRWGIETGYRVAKQVRPFTSSRNPSVRLVLFYFTMILYNMWAIANRIAGGGGLADAGGAYVRPPITMYRMMAAFRTSIGEMIRHGSSLPGPFFAIAAT